MAVLTFSSTWVLFLRTWPGENMRASQFVKKELKCSGTKANKNRIPETIQVAIVWPSFRPHIEPAKARAIVSDRAVPVPPTRPTQSRVLTL